MERDHARIDVVARTVALVVLATLLAGVYYWLVTRADPAKCLFGDAQCSQTVATFLLCVLTAGAFAATVRAFIYTRETYQHSEAIVRASLEGQKHNRNVFERDSEAVMTLQRCTHLEKAVFFPADPTEVQVVPRADHPRVEILHYFLRSLEQEKFTSVHPDDCIQLPDSDEPPYDRHDFDVLSLGRAPIVHGALYLHAPGRAAPYAIYVGSIVPNHYVHIILWIASSLGGKRGVAFFWSNEATQARGHTKLRYVPPPQRILSDVYQPVDYPTSALDSEESGVGAPEPA